MGRASRTTFTGDEASRRFSFSVYHAGPLRLVRDAMEGRELAAGRKHLPLAGIGERCGALTVTGYLVGVLGGVRAAIVRCDCRRPEYGVLTGNFRSSKSARCGYCAGTAADNKKRGWKHAHAMPETEHRRRLLARLASARIRCTSPNDASWANYGGRGIRVCDLWLKDRAAFLTHVRTLPGWDDPNLEMDRKDTDGHYQPGNIQFITRRQNILNRRKIPELQTEIERLRKENADLRSRLRRAEKTLHRLDGQRTVDRS